MYAYGWDTCAQPELPSYHKIKLGGSPYSFGHHLVSSDIFKRVRVL